MRLNELRSRAKAANVDAELLEGAMDGDHPKGAVIQLLLGVESPAEAARQELSGL
jgi:hypothetical protein